jgi:hypothetical protein
VIGWLYLSVYLPILPACLPSSLLWLAHPFSYPTFKNEIVLVCACGLGRLIKPHNLYFTADWELVMPCVNSVFISCATCHPYSDEWYPSNRSSYVVNFVCFCVCVLFHVCVCKHTQTQYVCLMSVFAYIFMHMCIHSCAILCIIILNELSHQTCG